MAQRQFSTNDTSVWTDKYGNGSDGDITFTGSGSDTTPKTSFGGTGGGTSATVGSGTGFANGNLVLLRALGSGATPYWELNKISSVGSGTNWTMAYALANTFSGGQAYLLKQYSSVKINAGVTLTAANWDGTTGGIIAFLCNGTITVTGTISAKGSGYRGGGGGVADAIGKQGEGELGLGTNSASANQCGGGGGSNLGSDAGLANATDNTLVTKVFFGGGGGSGGVASGTNQPGGAGGGWIFLIGKTITVTGALDCGGALGTSGNAAGGSGAGGSIILKGQTITVGSSLVTSLGGAQVSNTSSYGGGGGSGATVGGIGTGSVGGKGGNGNIAIYYGGSLSGTTNPTAYSTKDTALSTSTGGFFPFL